jgi:hypothetical protein
MPNTEENIQQQNTTPDNICSHTPYSIHLSTRYYHMVVLEKRINKDIGFHFWNKYVSSAFWSNISLPINLSITMLTALSTGQATTENLLPRNIYVNISVATLIVSTLNTYFRPHIQMGKNIEMMNKWNVLGCEFEDIYYSEKQGLGRVDECIEKYEKLLIKINDLKKTENMETQNFITDIIYLVLRSGQCCLRNRRSWLPWDEYTKITQRIKKHETEQTETVKNEPEPEIPQIYANL